MILDSEKMSSRILAVLLLCVVHVSKQHEQEVVTSHLATPLHLSASAVLLSTIFVTFFLLVFTLCVTYKWEVSNLSPETRQNHGKCLAATSLCFLIVSAFQLAIVYGALTSEIQYFLHIFLWILLFVLSFGFQIIWRTYGSPQSQNIFDGKTISRMFIYIWVIVMSMLAIVLIGWHFDELSNNYAALAFSFASPPLAMMIAKNFQYAKSFNESFIKGTEKGLSDNEIQNKKRLLVHLFAAAFVSSLLICTPLIAQFFKCSPLLEYI
ncbi:hypothetical protein B566_EDAN007152 [Ephemera danica]|nr:hypothetical protein B566_EDAN007152 [Ephemera danica]